MILELTRGEQALLDRALRTYAAHFQAQISKGTDEPTRRYLQDRIDATDALQRRVRPELQHRLKGGG